MRFFLHFLSFDVLFVIKVYYRYILSSAESWADACAEKVPIFDAFFDCASVIGELRRIICVFCNHFHFLYSFYMFMRVARKRVGGYMR